MERQDDQLKHDEMSRACSTHEKKNSYRISIGRLAKGDRFEGVGANGGD
jgi:hypothetical protein